MCIRLCVLCSCLFAVYWDVSVYFCLFVCLCAHICFTFTSCMHFTIFYGRVHGTDILFYNILRADLINPLNMYYISLHSPFDPSLSQTIPSVVVEISGYNQPRTNEQAHPSISLYSLIN